jgi:tetratricopeptide (TPR) repeat protein
MTADSSASGLARPSSGAIAAFTCVVVLLAVAVVILPVLSGGFLRPMDRPLLIEARAVEATARFAERPAVEVAQRLFLAGHALGTRDTNAARPSSQVYQPIAIATLALDAWLTGSSDARLFQYHLTNWALHLLNVLLVYLLVRRQTTSTLWAATAALFFGLHPAQLETIAVVSHRGTLLGTTFALMMVLDYLRFARSRRALALVSTLLSFAFAVLSSPIFIVLPLILVLLDYWPLRRFTKFSFLEKAPHLAILLGSIVWLRPAFGASLRTDWTPSLIVETLASFIQRLMFPVNLAPLTPTGDATGLPAVLNWIVVGLILATLLLSMRGLRPLFVTTAGVLCLLGPALLTAMPSESLAGAGWLYPSVAWIAVTAIPAIAAGIGASQRAPRLAAASSLLALALVIPTRTQSRVWHDGESVFKRVVAVYPGWSTGHVGLAEWYLLEGDSNRGTESDRALASARRAAELAPDDPVALFYLGTALLGAPDGPRMAINPLQRALQQRPDWVECLQNLGVAFAISGRAEEALPHLERARDLAPRSANVRLGLGHLYLSLNRPAEARGVLQEALRLQNEPGVHVALARAWAEIDEPDFVRRHLEAAVARDPRWAARAARYPALRRLADRPGFEMLIDKNNIDERAEPIESLVPAARSATGS